METKIRTLGIFARPASSSKSSVFVPYVVPFTVFAICTYAAPLFNISEILMYPIKTVLVAASLAYYWHVYKSEIKFSFDWLAAVSGIFVFFVWVLPEGLYPQIGYSEFNPFEYSTGYGAYLVITFRLAGATLVIPLMEELFWRSFALRFLIRSNFNSVPLGQFSWFSFIFISLAFGFEHHRWLVGIIAGMVYAGVLYRSKSLFSPILSHAVTNLLLGIYIISTNNWSFW
jgi:CAAX prenyl protease-like protein